MQSCDLVLEYSRISNSLESENFSLILATRHNFSLTRKVLLVIHIPVKCHISQSSITHSI